MGMQSNLQKTLSGPLTADQIPRAPLISPRLSRSVGGGMSKRKLATVAVNCLGAFPAAARVRGVRLEARLEVDVALPRRLGPVELGPRHVSSHGGYDMCLGLGGRHTPDSLRASLAGARRTPSRLGAPAGFVGRSEAGGWEAAQSAGSEPLQVRVLPEGWARSLGGRAPEL